VRWRHTRDALRCAGVRFLGFRIMVSPEQDFCRGGCGLIMHGDACRCAWPGRTTVEAVDAASATFCAAGKLCQRQDRRRRIRLGTGTLSDHSTARVARMPRLLSRPRMARGDDPSACDESVDLIVESDSAMV
jgi:hypothetical protein